MLRATALIAGPILFAALVFQLQAPGRHPGVYVEVDAGKGDHTYTLRGHAVGAVPVPSDVAMQTLGVNGILRSFFLVDPDPSMVAAGATAIKLYFLVVDNADETFRAEPIPMTVTVRQINPRVYRITAADLGPEGPGFQHYRRVLSRATGSRATMDLVVALVIQQSTGERRMYSVRFGPGS